MARIVVIGAGMGAMAAAARLAVAGHRVTAYERGETHGGAVRQYARDGFRFDTGPGLLQLPAVWRDLFVKTGREPLEDLVELRQVDPASRHHFADGTAVTLPAVSRGGVISALDAALGPGTGERWAALVGRARVAWDATRRPLLEEPLTDATDRAALARDPYPAQRGKRGLLRRRTPTLSEAARSELGDPRLVALLESYAVSYGLDPRRAPASATVLAYLEQTFGSWYVAGGMRALADAVRQRCVARGVEFVFGADVVRTVAKDGRAVGVELMDGTVVDADAVVDGAPGTAAAPTTPGQARLTVLLALRGARPADAVHRTVVHGPERTVTVLRPDDPALVPDAEHEAVTLSVPVPPDSPVGQEDAGRLIEDAEAAIPGLRERLLWHEVRTPSDNARETGAPGGAVPAPALAGPGGTYLRAANQGGLKGSYRVGGWAHPGGGLAHAGMSGAMAAGLLVEGDDWRGST